MWKSHFIVDTKGIVFHRGCGKGCGKLCSSVENFYFPQAKGFSTGSIVAMPVEMWKTPN